MAFTKITNTELNSRGATTLPNQPTISAAALKQEFDAPAKEIVAPHFNNLIDELEADTAGASIGLQAPSRRTGSTVKAVVDAISQDLVTVEGKLNGVTNAGLLDAISLKHEHENKALLDTYDQTNEDIEDAVNQKHSHSNKSVIDKWSESEGGAPLYNGQPMTGDMYSSEYDPDSTVKNAGGIKTYVTTGLGTKVDKVDGKGLSTNDFTDALKTKLDNIETGAEVNVQSDWNQSDNSADDYIKNKPSLGTSAYKNSTSVVKDSSDLVESGAVYDALGFGNKNLFLPIPFYTTSNISFVRNNDYGVTFTGKSNGTTRLATIGTVTLPAGHYIASGVSGGSNNTYGLRLTSTSLNITWYDGEQEFTLEQEETVSVVGRFSDSQTTDFNVTMYPMISKVGGAYEPYHASVEESLAEKADNSVIGTVEGANASKAWSVGEHFISGGQFKEVTQAIASGGAISDSNTKNKPVADAIVYKAGDSIELSASGNQIPYSGYITASSVWIRFFIPLNKKCVGISNVTFSNTTTLFVRGINGYLVNNLLLSSFTISIDQITDNGIYLQFSKSDGTAFDVTNNTPISVALSNASITFS